MLLDVWNADNITGSTNIGGARREAAGAANATILHVHLRQFGESREHSGVLVPAESHINIPTSPERHFAAIGVFMRGA